MLQLWAHRTTCTNTYTLHTKCVMHTQLQHGPDNFKGKWKVLSSNMQPTD